MRHVLVVFGIAFTMIVVSAPMSSAAPEGRGCCSHHRGVCSCSGGRAMCCDGTPSPTCGC